MICDSCGVEFCMYDLGIKIKFKNGAVLRICKKCWNTQPHELPKSLIEKACLLNKRQTGILRCRDCKVHGDFGEYKCPNCGSVNIESEEMLK